jgi:hypothetical protein
MWWPYRFRDANGSADPTSRVRDFASAVTGVDDAFVEAAARAHDGGVDVWFRSRSAPSDALRAWDAALMAHGLAAVRLKGRN